VSLIDKAEEVAKEVVSEVKTAAEEAVNFVEGVFSDTDEQDSSGNDGQDAADAVEADANGSAGGTVQGAAESANVSQEPQGGTGASTGQSPETTAS
jgi:hypothetical protein